MAGSHDEREALIDEAAGAGATRALEAYRPVFEEQQAAHLGLGMAHHMAILALAEVLDDILKADVSGDLAAALRQRCAALASAAGDGGMIDAAILNLGNLAESLEDR